MTSAARADSGTGIQNVVVNLAGLVQGITLVTFPAASSIFTDPREYGLSSTQYGTMFLPQVVTAVGAAVLGSGLAQRFTVKRVLLWGLACNLAAMLILLLSATIESDAITYPLLLAATAALGAGFGLTVPILNTLVSQFRPNNPDRAVLVLNALLGLGTALAPVFVAVFDGLGFWWGLPILSAALLSALLLISARLPLRSTGAESAPAATAPGAARARRGIPAAFWTFAGFAVLYGICETVNGNWSQLEMTSKHGASTTQASIALTVFWAMVTVGRVLFASIGRWMPPGMTYVVLPFVLIVSFVLSAALPKGDAAAAILVFAVAGLGCSALLPLTISFGQEASPAMGQAMASGVIATYQVGYGIAAFGVGPLVDHGVSLSAVFGWTAVAAAGLGALALIIVRRQAAGTRSARSAAVA